MQFSGRLVIIIALSITTLLASNIIAIKPVSLFELPFSVFGDNLFVVSAAIICFPISYIVSDVLTEVYGFRVARGVIWLGFVCNLMMVILFWLGGLIPGAVFWEAQDAYMTILGQRGGYCWAVYRIHRGRVHERGGDGGAEEQDGRAAPLVRTISSTVVGQGVDSVLFFSIAFGISGLWPWPAVFAAMIFAWLAKSIYEVLATPLTYLVVNWLKRTEQMDIYDAPRSLNPFGIFGEGEGQSRNAALGAAD